MNKKKYVAIFLTAQLILSASSIAFAGKSDIEVEDTNREYNIDVEDMLIELDKDSNENFTPDVPKEVDMSEYDEFQILDEKPTMEFESMDLSIESEPMMMRSMSFDTVDGMSSPRMLMAMGAPNSETTKSSKRFVYGYTSRGVLGGIQNELQQLVFKFKYDNNGNLIQIFE